MLGYVGLRDVASRSGGPRVFIFDETVHNLDQTKAEQFALTINKLKGKVTMLFITHQVPKGLQADGVVEMGPTIVDSTNLGRSN